MQLTPDFGAIRGQNGAKMGGFRAETGQIRADQKVVQKVYFLFHVFLQKFLQRFLYRFVTILGRCLKNGLTKPFIASSFYDKIEIIPFLPNSTFPDTGRKKAQKRPQKGAFLKYIF